MAVAMRSQAESRSKLKATRAMRSALATVGSTRTRRPASFRSRSPQLRHSEGCQIMETLGNKPRRRRSFTPEFKAEIVDLCQRGDRSVGQVARDFDLTET